MSVAPARVLVVDDSVLLRRLISDALAVDPRIEVVGTAANGRLALQKLERCDAEVVVLDVEMPELDGLGFLRELALRPERPRVIMFSTLTEVGAEVTMRALAAGADDYVQKPTKTNGVADAQERLRCEMIPKILGLVPRHAVAGPSIVASAPSLPRLAPRPHAPIPNVRVGVLVFGASTGGPNALADVIAALPTPLPVPALIVQHMPPLFTRLLAERLDRVSPFRVSEAVSGEPLEAGRVYVAPGGSHLAIHTHEAQRYVHLHDGPPENACRPAVDVLFRSAADEYGSAVLAVVLTGMGKDGLAGAEHVKRAGGQVITQDEATSVVWGMPGWVARGGFSDRILPLSEIASEITARLRSAASAPRLLPKRASA
ncbi:MAG: chemotaxis response regulator protein-glutamate methylesterase [Sandaracinaceae bacterium]